MAPRQAGKHDQLVSELFDKWQSNPEAGLLAAAALALPAAAAQTTTLEVVRYGWDNTTVGASETVSVSWMEAMIRPMGTPRPRRVASES